MARTRSSDNKASEAKKAPKTTKKVTKTTKKTKKVTKKQAAVEEPLANGVIIKDSLVDKAVDELYKWFERKQKQSDKKSLFEPDAEDLAVYLQTTSKKFFNSEPSLEPVSVKLPHSIHDLDEFEVCLFVPDDSVSEELAKKLLNIPNVTKIVTVNELKTVYKSFESRRRLLKLYDMFLADENVTSVLPKYLGKTFFKSNKFPIPVEITNESGEVSEDLVTKQVDEALKSVFYLPATGVNLTVRVGSATEPENIKDNVKVVLKHLEDHPLRMIQLKLKSSPGLPIYILKKVYDESEVLKEDEKPINVHAMIREVNNVEEDTTDFDSALLELATDEDQAKELLKRAAEEEEQRKPKKAKYAAAKAVKAKKED